MDTVKITKITYFDDDSFVGDYTGIRLSMKNLTTGEIIFDHTYGDHYHEKGEDRVEAVIEFCKEIFKKKYLLEFQELKEVE